MGFANIAKIVNNLQMLELSDVPRTQLSLISKHPQPQINTINRFTMQTPPPEDQIHAHFEKQLASYNLSNTELLEVREAVSRIVDQILDHYFDPLSD